MAHPIKGFETDRHGKRRLRRVYGQWIVALAEHGYHVRWNRDVNAAINMQTIFWCVAARMRLFLLHTACCACVDASHRLMRRHLYHFGKLPNAFLRSTLRSELPASITTRYHYSQEPGSHRFRRSIEAA